MGLSARLAAGVAAAAASSLALTACGSASDPYPPTGVDELVVPSPSLDPADFVERIDNPWLPLVPGSRWRYRRTGPGTAGTVTVTVLDETREVEGVPATVVLTVSPGVRPQQPERTYDWFAQDADGNVWHLGRATQQPIWEAGVDDAEAGLAMPAHPRVGDGYRTEYAVGLAEDRAQVRSLDASASVPYDDLTDLLDTEESSALEPGVTERKLYAQGIGLVREQTVTGGDELLVLVSFDPP